MFWVKNIYEGLINLTNLCYLDLENNNKRGR